MIINLFTELTAQSGYTPQASGTWAKVSGPGPSAPGTYNGTIDFTGTTTGNTIYTYTVTQDTCTDIATVTVQWTLTGARVNDECAGVITILVTSVGGVVSLQDQRFDGLCPTYPAATPSDDPPSNWGSITVDDLWYRVPAPANKGDYTMIIEIDGSPYSTDGVFSPLIAAYSSCDVADLLEANVPTANYNAAIGFSVLDSPTYPYYYIRVGRDQASTGGYRFDINISTF